MTTYCNKILQQKKRQKSKKIEPFSAVQYSLNSSNITPKYTYATSTRLGRIWIAKYQKNLMNQSFPYCLLPSI
jgi:hypothetical protein